MSGIPATAMELMLPGSGFEGVAPKAQLSAWRIFGCDGDTDDDIILQAAELAAKSGVDIINLSLGGGLSAWQEDALAVALSNLVDTGIVVIVAQGNEGRDGVARTPSPSIGQHVLTVASTDNTERMARVLHVMNGSKIESSFEYTLSDENQFTLPNLTNLSSIQTRAACDPIREDLAGQMVLVPPRGRCTLGRKASHLQKAGATGLLVVGSDEEEEELSLEKIQLPVIYLDEEDALVLSNFLSQRQALTLNFASKPLHIQRSGAEPSIFSTWGSDAELHLKPDIAAVGGYVFSTYPVRLGKSPISFSTRKKAESRNYLGSYMTMSGTSMATPYLSGCIALYMQARGRHAPRVIYRALANHARPVMHTSLQPQLESPIKQGAGLVQIYDTIKSTTEVDPFRLALNDTEHFKANQTLQIKNHAKYPQTYRIIHRPAIAVSGYRLQTSAVPARRPAYLNTSAIVHFEPETIVLKGGQTGKILVTFQPPVSALRDNHLLYGGYLQINAEAGTNATQHETIHVPYFGALGNQRDLPIFDAKQGYPYIGNKLGEPLSGHEVYQFDRDVLYLYTRIGSPTSILKTELLDRKNTTLGEIPEATQQWLARNDHSRDNHDYMFDWRGNIKPIGHRRRHHHHHRRARVVAPGTYRIKMSALRMLGDPQQTNDWEVWYSPLFDTIA
ncbi:hypothetical protein DFQ30_004800 [Apophysomyces sp. BC1015]|nr:hypothetical protein DFQ30_004800 [Apophysomyces sp. BC1015]